MLVRSAPGSDFQSREYFKISLSHLDGRSIDDLGAMVKYQVDCMRAVASGLMPPAPPLGLDMSPPKEGMPSATASPPMIEAEPFDSSAFTSEVVREEHPGLRSLRFQRFYHQTSELEQYITGIQETSHTDYMYLYVTIFSTIR